jgi:UDP-glucuronate 4-epimerase
MAYWLFTEAILRGKPIKVFNNGEMRRDFTYIDDIVSGVVAASDHHPTVKEGAVPHRIYNIGNNRPEPLLKLIALIEKAIGMKARIDFWPMQPGDVQETYADVNAIRNDLGFEPEITLEEGIPRFVHWYRDYFGRRDNV